MSKVRRLITNKAEAEFARHLDKQGKLYFFHPRSFRIPGGRYQPDFYVVEDGCFYEVCGTHQAYSYNRKKFEAFRVAYPQYRLEIVNGGAWKHGPGRPRVEAPLAARRGRPLGRAHGDIWSDHTPLIDAMRPILAEKQIRTVAELARVLGVGYPTIYGALVNPRLRQGAVDRWVALAKESLEALA